MPLNLHHLFCQLVDEPVDLQEKKELFAARFATINLNLAHQGMQRDSVGVVPCRVRTRHINH